MEKIKFSKNKREKENAFGVTLQVLWGKSGKMDPKSNQN